MVDWTKEVSSRSIGMLFMSDEKTGTGSEQSIAHGMGRVPERVMVLVSPGDAMASGAITVVEGTHTDTYIKVTVTVSRLYKIIAFG